MKYSKRWFYVAASVAALITIGSNAAAQAEDDAPAPETSSPLAARLAGLNDESNPAMAGWELAHVRDRSSIGEESGRVLVQTASERFAAVATPAGEVCFVASTASQIASSECVVDVDEAGLAYVAHRRSGTGWWIAGLAEDGVTEITVTTAANITTTATLGDNGFLWHGEDAADQPVSLSIVRSGQPHTVATGIPSGLA